MSPGSPKDFDDEDTQYGILVPEAREESLPDERVPPEVRDRAAADDKLYGRQLIALGVRVGELEAVARSAHEVAAAARAEVRQMRERCDKLEDKASQAEALAASADKKISTVSTRLRELVREIEPDNSGGKS